LERRKGGEEFRSSGVAGGQELQEFRSSGVAGGQELQANSFTKQD
jgi:hypothetical protein